MAVVAVLALIIFISPVSAEPIGDHDITFVSHTFDGTHSTWTYEVNSSFQPAISHWIIAWCNPGAIVEASEDYVYGADPSLRRETIIGIKFDTGYNDNGTRTVWFTLEGDFEIGEVRVGIKAGQTESYGYVAGPVNCTHPIPEFTTIAIPVAAILGLMFLFNHHKRKKS